VLVGGSHHRNTFSCKRDIALDFARDVAAQNIAGAKLGTGILAKGQHVCVARHQQRKPIPACRSHRTLLWPHGGWLQIK